MNSFSRIRRCTCACDDCPTFAEWTKPQFNVRVSTGVQHQRRENVPAASKTRNVRWS